MLLLLLSFFQLFSASSDTLLHQSQAQAEYYIQQIEEEEELEVNLWALTVLTQANTQIKTYVEQKVKESTYSNKLLDSFRQIDTSFNAQLEKVVLNSGSSPLLLALLLNIKEAEARQKLKKQFDQNFRSSSEQQINYSEVIETIIHEGKIGSDILTTNQFTLPHFFLLFYNDYINMSESYLKDLSNNLQLDNSRSNLRSFLSNATKFRIHYLLDEYGKTNPLFNSLMRDNYFPNSSIKLSLYRYIDYSMYRLGYFDRSLEITRKYTLPLSKYLDKKNIYLQTRQLQAVYLYSIGKLDRAENIFQEVLNNVSKSNPQLRLSSIYNNLALAKYKLGKYQQYLDLQLSALNRAKSKGNYNHQWEIYNNLYIYYRKINDEEEALSYLEKARNLAKSNNNKADLGKVNISTGAFYREFQRNFSKAHHYYLEAEQSLDPQNNKTSYFELLNEQAEAYEMQSKFKKALNKLNKLSELASSDNNPIKIETLINKALINLKIGNINTSKKIIEKFKLTDLSNLDFEQIIKAKTVEANYLSKTGSPQEAIQILEPALTQVVVRAKSSADLKSGFWHVEEEYLDAFELTVDIYKDLGQPGKAVEKLDQLKTINDASLYQNPLVKSSLLNESELTQYKQLTEQLDATRKKLLTASENRQFELRQKISQLKLKKRKLDRKLTQNTKADPISVRAVQNELSARELVLHITELKDKYHIAQISRSNIEMNTIELDSTMRNLLSGSVQQVATNDTNLDSLYKISKVLKLEEIPDRIEQITLIPDSYFYQLPMDILPLEQPTHSYSYGQVTYVIEKFRTHYLTSLNDFKSDSKIASTNVQNRLGYTGYGVSNFEGYQDKSLVPLPHARTEISNIARQLTNLSNVQTYINEESTKSTFTRTAPRSQIIHLATHSEVSERDPMFSTIYLSKNNALSDSTFANQLFAYELFELNLSNEMIMLNSCESGSGSYIQGTGVMGISRALQYAGARSLVLNLWSVNDQLASDFAVYFYDQLNKGKSKAEALRDTKQYFLRTKNASPHFWGPYMLIGNIDPIVQPEQDTNLAMAGAFIFYFLLMVGLSYLAQQGMIFSRRRKK